MAERAHPDDPAFVETVYGRALEDRYAYARDWVQELQVLDIPCGTGWGSSLLKGASRVVGVDIDFDSLRFASTRYQDLRLTQASMLALPFRDESFDAVCCLEGLEHIFRGEAETFLDEVHRILKADGTLVLTTPQRTGGRHSGNPYHHYEFTPDELRQLLECRFAIVESTTAQAGDGIEMRCVVKRKDISACRPARAREIEPTPMAAAGRWLQAVAVEQGYRYTTGGLDTLASTAIGVLLEESLGTLRSMTQARRQALVDRLQGSQDAVTGYFVDRLTETVPIDSGLHDASYQRGMFTYFTMHALDALGEKSKSRLAFLDEYRSSERLVSWLEGLNWSNPWLESNRIMCLLAAILHSHEWHNDPDAYRMFHEILDWLDASQDPQTGLWGTQHGASTLNAAAGAYHFVPFYRYAHRPIPRVSLMLESTLSLQQPDGLFGPGPGGGACEDLDAVDLICSLGRTNSKAMASIKRPLTRAYWAIRNLQNEDGSFPYMKSDSGARYKFGSWPAMEADLGGGDVWATWFRLLALHTIHALIPGDVPDIGPWTFRRLPALGYHRTDGPFPSTPPGRDSVWFRPLAVRDELNGEAPAVSVVVTCFNLGEYLYESLSSAFAQDIDSLEVIVVDDGSTDAFTTSYLDFLAGRGLKLIRTTNRGLPAARNVGIAAAKGKYICCLDADDILHRSYIRKAAALLDSDDKLGYVSCYYRTFDEDNSEYRYDKCRLPEMLVQNETVGGSVFRKTAWEGAGGYCESLTAMQDWDFWIGILQLGYRAECIREVLFDYRSRAGSMYTRTRTPHIYAGLAAQIVARHKALYTQYFDEVLRLRAFRFAELVNVRLGEIQGAAAAARQSAREVQALRREVEENARLIRACEDAKSWLEAERAKWEDIAHAAHANAARPQMPEFETASLRREVPGALQFAKNLLWMIWQALRPSALPSGAWNLLLWFRMRWFDDRGNRIWRDKFNDAWYLWQYPDVQASALPPALHYLFCGYREGRAPGPTFDGAYYLEIHPDVRSRGINPLIHYCIWGASEERKEALPLPTPRLWPRAQERKRPSIPAERVRPLVSVVIPCFNYGKYLEGCLQSVLNQTFTNLEIVVVEGGSTDSESLRLFAGVEERYRDRVAFVRRSEPRLVGDNRNFGIERARGRYVCCLDADDALSPTYLEIAVFLLEHLGIDFVSCSLREFGDSDLRWNLSDPSWPQIMRENQVSTTAVFRKEMWATLGGFRDWGKGDSHVPEDWDFWIRALGNGFHGVAIREPLLLYRVHEDSLSHSAGDNNLARWRQALGESNADLARLDHPRPRPDFALAPADLESLAIQSETGECVLMALPFLTRGGAERIFETLGRSIVARGGRVIILTTLDLPPSVPDITSDFRKWTPYVYPLRSILWGRPETWHDFVLHLVKTHGVRNIYLSGCDLVYQLLPRIKQECSGAAVVDQLFNGEVHYRSNRRYRDYIDMTVVPSAVLSDRLIRESNESPGRIAVIPHGVEVPESLALVSNPEGTGLPDSFRGCHIVSFFGRLSPEKAPLDFVAIAESLRGRNDVRFLLTGEGPLRNEVLDRIERLKLGPVIHAPGFVEDQIPYMAESTIVVLPSRLDGMPLVVLEAQLMGKPVVASSVGSIPEVIVDGSTGVLCEPGNIGQFVSSIESLLDSERLRNDLGTRAREYAMKRHSAAAMVKAYDEAFAAARKLAQS